MCLCGGGIDVCFLCVLQHVCCNIRAVCLHSQHIPKQAPQIARLKRLQVAINSQHAQALAERGCNQPRRQLRSQQTLELAVAHALLLQQLAQPLPRTRLLLLLLLLVVRPGRCRDGCCSCLCRCH